MNVRDFLSECEKLETKLWERGSEWFLSLDIIWAIVLICVVFYSIIYFFEYSSEKDEEFY